MSLLPRRTFLARCLALSAADASLQAAMDAAARDMIALLHGRRGLPRLDAYALASLAMDARVGDMREVRKSVHCVVPKSLWVGGA
jgi:acetamidase/formamidase